MAEELEAPETEDEEATTTDDKPEGSDALGDAGKKALDTMKASRLLARKERDAAKAEAAALKTEIAKLKGDKPPEVDEKAIRDQAKREAQAEVLRDRILDRIETKAAKLFADPEDARALLAAEADEFADEGKIDDEAITKALATLLKKKPHLGAQGGKRFEGSADGGARKGSNAPAQLTEQDLKRMTPEQIVKARENGQFADLLG